jgi:hypothetical protein
VDAPRAAAAPILRHHVVLVLVDQLDVAAARAIQYARTLTPDELRAVHFAIDMARADELRAAWIQLGLDRVTLDVIDCPDRRLVRAAVELVADALSDGDTEVTVLLPRVEHGAGWHRLLHDRTSSSIAKALTDFPHANVTFVPYHLGRRPQLTDKPDAKVRSPKKRGAPPVHRMPVGLNLPEGTISIGDADRRQRVCIAGRIRSVRVQPRAGVATLQCTLDDGTGEINLVFLGRRHVAGLAPGVIIAANGTVGERAGRQEILNPDYELLAASEHG